MFWDGAFLFCLAWRAAVRSSIGVVAFPGGRDLWVDLLRCDP